MGHELLLCTHNNHTILDDMFGNNLLPGTQPTPQNGPDKNDWYPFTSHVKFETAEFLFTTSQMPQSHVDRLMQLWTASVLHHNEWAPFVDHVDLHQVINTIPHGDIPWKSFQVKYAGKIPECNVHGWMSKGYDIWFWDPNAVVKTLLGNPDFHKHFNYVPYHEFEPTEQHRWENFISGNWAWHHADILAKDPAMHGAMLVPIILGSDKTTVSVATGQNDYYPLYLSIGNIHNNTHQAHCNSVVLLAFLTIPKSIEDTAEFRKFRCQLFHTTLAHILSSLRDGMSKPEVQQCPDGHFRCTAYALAAYIAEYPEQVLLSCLIQGWCPICTSMSNNLDGHDSVLRSHQHMEFCICAFVLVELWDQYSVVGNLMPFTNDFPHADIYKMLTPDLLHQTIKGIFKDHLVTWIGEYLKITHGEAEANWILDDINRRIAAIPLYPNLQHFPEGWRFKQWTGDDSKALMKVYLPAIEVSAFLDFCYYAQRNSLDETALGNLGEALQCGGSRCNKCFHHHHCVFQETGVCDNRPKGFLLPWQHSMNHYQHLIQEFGAPNGLCSSITESKHIKAVKQLWRCSNHFEALVNFKSCSMLKGSILSATMEESDILHHGDIGLDNDNDSEGSDVDDNEVQVHDGPHVLNYVCLAKTPVCKYPSSLDALACHVQHPNLPLLTCHFLHSQLHNDTSQSAVNVVLPDLSDSPVSVFCSTILTFYTPSDLSGLGGMHLECIWIFLEQDPDIPGMGGLHIGRVFLFFSFTYDDIKYNPCALIQWFSNVSDGPDKDTGMWVVQPDYDANGQQELEVVHIHSILHGAHLIPVYGHTHPPTDIQYTNSLDVFQAYYVNKYIDHHTFEIAF
ncbi:hypothetical protein EDD17DRAFT_1775610 [Pisolithus thermaeus]|nr:hypothetical protein EDD17DRAFT_1775610 [Pisolithus thermaeus]